jgi:hypothetical protein
VTWLIAAARNLVDLYRRGFLMFAVALPVLMLVMLPEMLQHIAEIHLGMFESREAFRAAGANPLRMGFGIVKVAGLALTFLAAARFWWARDHGGRWWKLGEIRWGAFLAWLILFFVIPLPALALDGRAPAWLLLTANLLLSIASLPLLIAALAALFGQRLPIGKAYRTSWRHLPLLILLLAAAFVPAQFLHQQNHLWALGQPLPIVVALMIFDTLVVGFLAGATGTALYLGYRAMDGTLPGKPA